MNIQNIPDELLEELCLEVRFFFLNYPYKQCRKLLWQFYTASVYHSADSSSGQENSNRLFMYERIEEFLRLLNALDKKMQGFEPVEGSCERKRGSDKTRRKAQSAKA
ncbi:hypothetical protein HNQ91_003990 [Filimonas zeae]|uniref:Uncharacterized protein n=1 Tax=Filimonas zeae TaxID=1737353 RepID=A0A917N006_9BACT|nr:hypothetical protein [Filimonas zeae]MDR6340917.1 hypothetical protein [Filimonas zeae]GGH77954.1 hypothetical protein GCM10011379_45080 [Filimonas zeae]